MLVQLLHPFGGKMEAAMAVPPAAPACRRARIPAIFARLRRAWAAREARAWPLVEVEAEREGRAHAVPMRERGETDVTAAVTSVTEVTGGQKCDKNFLLHQSTDLVELYPTVPLRQIVRRGKHFSRSLEVVARPGVVHL